MVGLDPHPGWPTRSARVACHLTRSGAINEWLRSKARAQQPPGIRSIAEMNRAWHVAAHRPPMLGIVVYPRRRWLFGVGSRTQLLAYRSRPAHCLSLPESRGLGGFGSRRMKGLRGSGKGLGELAGSGKTPVPFPGSRVEGAFSPKRAS
jgi:hypothetical protein